MMTMNHHHLQHNHHGQQKNNIYHQQRQEHNSQLLTNIRVWLGAGEQLKLMPSDVQRRTKRTVPEMEKDDRYWEKRKRNNMAAQRSREHKRVLEKDMKQKVSCLEEQNALLRKEIVLIKRRVGLPLEQCVLTPEERAQCVLEVKQAQEYNRTQQRRDSGTDDVTSTSQTNDPEGLPQSINEKVRNRRESSGSCRSSPNLLEESSTSGLNNAISNYGNFTSSPNWSLAHFTPVSSFSMDHQNERYSPEDSTQFNNDSIALQERNSKGNNLVIGTVKATIL